MNYFDCHVDTLTEITEKNDSLWRNSCDLDLQRVTDFTERYTQIFAIWKDRKSIEKEQLDDTFARLYDRTVSLLTAQENAIVWCKTGQDMEEAHAAGKAAGFLSIEDFSIMGSALERIHELGFRFAMPAWNYENEYACGAVSDQKKGLTPDGQSAVRMLLEQGIVMDISHLSDKGVEEVFTMTDCPVMASHSDVRDIRNVPRNLKKEQIQELIRRKGLIGINFFAPFVGEDPGITDILRHMDYILELGGEDVLAIGSDFDGCDGLFPKGIRDVRDISGLRESIVREGFGDKLAEKIFFENARRFVLENVK